MVSMSYCRHENTAADLGICWEQWYDDEPDTFNQYEQAGRRRIVKIVREMHQEFEDDGTYERLDAKEPV